MFRIINKTISSIIKALYFLIKYMIRLFTGKCEIERAM